MEDNVDEMSPSGEDAVAAEEGSEQLAWNGPWDGNPAARNEALEKLFTEMKALNAEHLVSLLLGLKEDETMKQLP